MRNVLLTAAAAFVLGTAGASAATTWGSDAYGRPLAQVSQPFDSVQPAVSYSVGSNGGGTATGGPVGGLSSRN